MTAIYSFMLVMRWIWSIMILTYAIKHVKQGLCKLGSYGGSDASVKTFADGSNQTLAKACRRYVLSCLCS